MLYDDPGTRSAERGVQLGKGAGAMAVHPRSWARRPFAQTTDDRRRARTVKRCGWCSGVLTGDTRLAAYCSSLYSSARRGGREWCEW